jgi:hypothetical protein
MSFQVNEFCVIAAGIMHYILYLSYKKTPYFDEKEAWHRLLCSFSIDHLWSIMSKWLRAPTMLITIGS